MPEFKSGVVMWRMHPEIENQLDALDQVSNVVLGRRAIITAARDGFHSSRSFHYKGAAIDLRTRDIASQSKRREYRDAIAARLGPQWDVILESDHIHVEFDPD